MNAWKFVKFTGVLVFKESSILSEDDMKTWKLVLYSNMAHTQLNTELFREAVVSCDFALEVDPDNVKALYRKARVRFLAIFYYYQMPPSDRSQTIQWSSGKIFLVAFRLFLSNPDA